MAKVIALYKRPADATVFDSYYFSKHVPIAKKIPGLQRYEVSTGAVATPVGESPFHLTAVLTFESLSAIQQALTSPEGGAVVADLANFAQAGVDLLFFDSKDV